MSPTGSHPATRQDHGTPDPSNATNRISPVAGGAGPPGRLRGCGADRASRLACTEAIAMELFVIWALAATAVAPWSDRAGRDATVRAGTRGGR
jgi:hypothetical protein